MRKFFSGDMKYGSLYEHNLVLIMKDKKNQPCVTDCLVLTNPYTVGFIYFIGLNLGQFGLDNLLRFQTNSP